MEKKEDLKFSKLTTRDSNTGTPINREVSSLRHKIAFTILITFLILL